MRCHPWVHFPRLFLTAVCLSAGIPHVMGVHRRSLLAWTASGNASSLRVLLGQNKGRKGPGSVHGACSSLGYTGQPASSHPQQALWPWWMHLCRSVFKSSRAGLSPRQWGGGTGGSQRPPERDLGLTAGLLPASRSIWLYNKERLKEGV